MSFDLKLRTAETTFAKEKILIHFIHQNENRLSLYTKTNIYSKKTLEVSTTTVVSMY